MTAGAQPKGEAAVSLKRLIGWGIIGQLAFVASQFVLLLALSRFASVTDVGHFGLATAIATPIYFMLGFGFRVNQATDVQVRFSFRDFMGLRLICTTLSYLVIVIIGFVFLDPAARWVLLAFAASRGAETTSTVTYGLFQKFDRMDRVALSLLLRGVGGAALFTAVIAATRSPLAAYVALFVLWSAIAGLLDVPFARALARGTEEDRPATRENMIGIVRTSWPIAVNGLLSGSQGSIPRFFINGVLGLAALGHFTIVAYAMQATNTVTNAIAQSIVARMAHLLQAGNLKAYFRILYALLGGLGTLGALGAAVALVIGDPLLQFVFGPDYAGLATLLALCVVTAAISSGVNILQSGLNASRQFMRNMWIRIATVAVVTGASFAGAKWAGLEGVVVAMGLTSLFQAVLLIIQIRVVTRSTALRGAA